jgi:short-subunit dehydrogenase
MKLHNKKIVLTGASGGIGAQTADAIRLNSIQLQTLCQLASDITKQWPLIWLQ